MKLFWAAAVFVAAACARETTSDVGPQAGEKADFAIVNAKIRTMDWAGEDPSAEGGTVAAALCVAGGVFTHVGADASDCVGTETRVVDAGGRLVLPGLIDSHSHILGGAISEQKVNLSLADTMEKLLAALAAIRDDNPGDGVVYARGWQNHLFPPEGPRASLLDQIFGDRPVILSSVDGHSTWFSSKALALGGADAATPDPVPGVSFFERDPETGALLGTAREGAGSFIVEKLVSRKTADYEAALRRFLPRAAQAGLTGMFDAGMGAPSEEEAYGLLARLEREGALSLRVFASTADRDGEDDPAARLVDLRARHQGDRLRPAAVKLFADGVPEAHTAFLSSDYVDRPGSRGAPMTSPERMARLILSAEEKGVSAHVHAIGGGAVKMTLDAVEAARAAVPGDGPRHAIAHMDLVDAVDIPRFAALGVVAQTSIQWATRDPSFDNIARFVGEGAMEAAYPVRTLIDAGAVQSFGADWPAASYLSTFEPMTLIEVAVTRRLPGRRDLLARNPDEALTVAEAVAGMTRASAFQLGEEARLGSIEAGKAADLIILDKDIFAVDPFEIHTARALMTMVGGDVVHAAGPFTP